MSFSSSRRVGLTGPAGALTPQGYTPRGYVSSNRYGTVIHGTDGRTRGRARAHAGGGVRAVRGAGRGPRGGGPAARGARGGGARRGDRAVPQRLARLAGTRP